MSSFGTKQDVLKWIRIIIKDEADVVYYLVNKTESPTNLFKYPDLP